MNANGTNFWWLLGALCGVLTVIVVYLVKRAAEGKTADFDERQTAARGEAFKYAFFTTAAAELFYVCAAEGGFSPLDTALGSILAVLLGVTVFAVIAVVRDAYLSLREKPRSTVILSALMIAMNLLIGIPKLTDGRVFQNGQMTFDGVSLVIAAMFAVILAVFVIHWIRGRRDGAAREEDE